MGKARIATPALLERIERVCRMRLAAEQIPSDAQLAFEWGVSRRLIRHWIGRIRRSVIASGQPDLGKIEVSQRISTHGNILLHPLDGD